MIQEELPWNLHDAIVIDCKFWNDQWIVNVQLYEIFYPGKPKLKLVFSGIHNKSKVEKLHAAIAEDGLEHGWNGTRINTFHYDTKKESKTGDLYLFFNADHADPLTIHCQKLTIEVH